MKGVTCVVHTTKSYYYIENTYSELNTIISVFSISESPIKCDGKQHERVLHNRRVTDYLLQAAFIL